jgi:hypothetical protein
METDRQPTDEAMIWYGDRRTTHSQAVHEATISSSLGPPRHPLYASPLHASRPHPTLELCCARVSSRRGTSSDTLPPPPPLHASRPHPIQLCCARVSSRRGTSSDTLLPPPPLHASRPHTAQLPSAMRPGLFAPRDQLGHAPPSSTAARLSTAHCSTAFCNAPGSLRALRGLSSACSLLAIWHTEIR